MDDPNQTGRKLVMGLRQVATDLIGRGEREVECASEQHGFDLEAMPQYADRINGFATELAQAIGYVEPGPELATARELAAQAIERQNAIQLNQNQRLPRYRVDSEVVSAEAMVSGLRDGRFDKSTILQDMLHAVYAGRALAEADHRKQRIVEMLTPAPRQAYVAPDRLTVTIEGPQASGKTRVARWIMSRCIGYVGLNPRVIEIGNDGRRFDAVNEEFIDRG